MSSELYLQIFRLTIFFAFLLLSFNTYFAWKKDPVHETFLYLVSLSIFTSITFWSFFSLTFLHLTDRLKFPNYILITSGYLLSVLLFLYLQYLYWRVNKQMRNLSNAELLEQFIDGAKKHVQSAETRDIMSAEIGIKAVEEMKQSYFEMKRRQPGLQSLKSLLSHADMSVRMWTARRLLDKYEKESLITLDEIANGNSYVSNKSQQIATAWRQGKLKF